MNEEPEPFLTSDLPLATYLHYRGMQLLQAVPDKYEGRRKLFVFLDEEERPRYEQEWLDNEGGYFMFWESYKAVKRRLGNEK